MADERVLHLCMERGATKAVPPDPTVRASEPRVRMIPPPAMNVQHARGGEIAGFVELPLFLGSFADLCSSIGKCLPR